MKIACLCNINHYLFILSRYLRDMGHEVSLFLIEEYAHFYPESDAYGEIENIRIVELPWRHKELYKLDKKEILAAVGGFDLYVACEFGPAFLFKAGIKTDIFIPIGTDLIDYPFEKPDQRIPDTWAIDQYQFNLFQKAGIRNAGAIFMNAGGDLKLEYALKKIKFKGRRYPLSLPYLYLPEYEKPNAVSKFESEIRALKVKNDLFLISHGRCEFTQPSSVHYKGTEIMLKGLAEYIHAGHPDTRLVALEYGSDVQAAKNLAEELGITQNIHWLPQSGRKDIFPVLQYFDAAFGILCHGQWSYNVAMEAIAAGVPFIQKGPENTKERAAIYPFNPAHSPETIKNMLECINNDPAIFKERAVQAKKWIKEEQIEKVLKNLQEYLGQFGDRSVSSAQGKMSRIFWWYLDVPIRFLSRIKWKLQN